MAHEGKSYKKDELMELLWHLDESHDLTLDSLRSHDENGIFESTLLEFSSNGILKLEGKFITLTDEGRQAASDIVRRHRLAERLLVDVMRKTPSETEVAACEFEHILATEIVESICTLLGHPRFCPHGSPIPRGRCCEEATKTVNSLTMPVYDLSAGQTAKVAFINATDANNMNKLLCIGITPGSIIKLQQKRPALVLEVNKTIIAIDDSLGKEINVWRSASN
ncbi:MAG: metal-dependent transcriptional regulator [Nitrospinae bacterium]|nr:metal-dependent transcriptional regulator [Nitrospinota bacterium]MBF0634347.1 metal-dependent transcriptional regulator [Nitrospinota bacterium]